MQNIPNVWQSRKLCVTLRLKTARTGGASALQRHTLTSVRELE